MSKAFLRMPTVTELFGLSKNAIYDRLNPKSPRHDPSFPKPVKLGSHSVAFVESEVHAYMQSCIEARNQGGKK
jgi:prophage regulatory protein